MLLTGIDIVYMQNLINDLNTQFALKDLWELDYVLGLEAYRLKKWLFCQSKYASDLLLKTKILEANASNTLIAANSRLHLQDGEMFDNPILYKSTIRALQYLVLIRSDLAFVVNKLSQFLKALLKCIGGHPKMY